MAKKKQGPSLSDLAERAMRAALDNVPELKACSEAEYVEAVAEAASAIETGADMRAQELQEENEDAG